MALGVALHAARVELCKAEIDGVYDADPQTHGHARRYHTLTHAEALNHPAAVPRCFRKRPPPSPAAGPSRSWSVPPSPREAARRSAVKAKAAQELCAFEGVLHASVYGVAIPGTEGRAGMAAIVCDCALDLAVLHRHLAERLPAYACPLFLRLCPQAEVTGTFKYAKADFVRQGFNPRHCSDPLYFNHPELCVTLRSTRRCTTASSQEPSAYELGQRRRRLDDSLTCRRVHVLSAEPSRTRRHRNDSRARANPTRACREVRPSQDLLSWMSDQFERFGNTYRASVYGTNVYVVRDPEHVDHVLRDNWQNYKKGQAIKRVGFLLGNGLMVSEGEFWKSQRRMIQPAFHDKAIGALINVISAANIALLKKWENAAQEKDSVNVTRDISHMVLKVVLISIFGDDYEQVAAHFNILSDESARNLQFAQGSGLWERSSPRSPLKDGKRTERPPTFSACSWQARDQKAVRRCQIANWSARS